MSLSVCLPPFSVSHCLSCSSSAIFFFSFSVTSTTCCLCASFLSEPRCCSSVPHSFKAICFGKTSPGPAPGGEWLLPRFDSEMGRWPNSGQWAMRRFSWSFLTSERGSRFGLGLNCVEMWRLNPLQPHNKDQTKNGRVRKWTENPGLGDIAVRQT